MLRNLDAPCRTVARDFVSPRAPRRITTSVAASRAGHERRLRGALKRLRFAKATRKQRESLPRYSVVIPVGRILRRAHAPKKFCLEVQISASRTRRVRKLPRDRALEIRFVGTRARFRTSEFEPAPRISFREARGAGVFVCRGGGISCPASISSPTGRGGCAATDETKSQVRTRCRRRGSPQAIRHARPDFVVARSAKHASISHAEAFASEYNFRCARFPAAMFTGATQTRL